ncbi:3-phosphoshikimate 1-carboxyvinyltransferase [Rhodopirellula sallentina]|uniref:3-phosphoshikimate 1-carboxyvinyltransferase n=1 Tax=Rhodopirellula sallentina SM41 TaxID=1263870 RepID=M5U5A9_9BACT|nr:3-phosphoshikimate 1-carboxyvinyltransferase [Rhodopirellula sallentina]EMI56459.1 5-enolpyruvylshikimate-3-phosphate synthase [Rhodopirellula sallentina SM41]
MPQSASTLTDSDSSPVTRVSVVPGGPVEGKMRPPGSKSLTNRALICAAFASGTSRLSGTLVSEDTEVMIESLAKIGVSIKPVDGGRTLVVEGVGGVVSDDARKISSETPVEMFIANSGTTVRFLTAALSAFGGKYRLSGIDRMHERPIGDLVDAIAPALDGSIAATSEGKCPPVDIDSKGWTGQPMRVGGGVSSQYLSGLMMAGPIASKPIRIEIVGEMVSIPYVRMTARLMESFGGVTGWEFDGDEPWSGLRCVNVEGSYQGCEFDVEPDASAASYFWAAAAISGGRVRVEGLTENATQGDVRFARVLEQMGCQYSSDENGITIQGGPLSGIDVEMGEISDTVQTLAVVALFADGPTRVRGVAHNRFKETDRIGNLAIELRKLGARVDEHDDGLTIHPLSDPARLSVGGPVVMETYNDHRMAMSFALLGLRLPGIEILNPACTRKTYPDFWADLQTLTGRSHVWTTTGATGAVAP